MPVHAVYDWDEAKRRLNIADHGIDFTSAENFDWDSAVIDIDDREDYGELRERAWGFIGEALYLLVFTRRRDVTRIISLRKAHAKEARRYAKDLRRSYLARGEAQGPSVRKRDD